MIELKKWINGEADALPDAEIRERYGEWLLAAVEYAEADLGGDDRGGRYLAARMAYIKARPELHP